MGNFVLLIRANNSTISATKVLYDFLCRARLKFPPFLPLGKVLSNLSERCGELAVLIGFIRYYFAVQM